MNPLRSLFSGRTETVGQTVIVLGVAMMAGAASFTHVHDWTMDNSPAGTPDWFGWANAIISELTPFAAGLDIKRRRRLGKNVGYPAVVLVAAIALSLAAQFAQAESHFSGWLLAAVPALAFLALSKMVLSRPAETKPAIGTPETSPDTMDSTHETIDAGVSIAATPTPVMSANVIRPSGVMRPVIRVNGSEVTR